MSISNAQRKFFPDLNYTATIYNGIEIEKFKFNQGGGGAIMWAGRGVPDKGLETVFEIIHKLGKEAKIFLLRKDEHLDWLNKLISTQENLISSKKISLEFEKNRNDLVLDYQTSKLFLFPIQWEEPFGLVLIESMATGTPVVAYAKGSVPEIIRDGETGFIVNSNGQDIRGDWIIKKTGFEGLCEAVEKIYSMKQDEYEKMRLNCRTHVEKNFTAQRMANSYLKAYEKLVGNNP